MTEALIDVIAEQWLVVAGIVIVLFMFYCGGPWRFLVRMFATTAAISMALSSFCGLMDLATRTLIGMTWEAGRQCWREFLRNRRDALAEMGEKA